jgi:ornithine carbamoyltransferase
MVKNLLNISDLNKQDIIQVLDYSVQLNTNNETVLNNKNIGLIFEKYSTRTRLSFQVGINQLGGNPIDIRFEELNLQRVESFDDTFKILSLYLDNIVFRTSRHEKLIKAVKNFNKPIINGLSDLSHPCQIISDLYTLRDHFKSLNGLSIIWLGDMNNVLYSYFELINLFPEITFSVFTNKGIYENKIKLFPENKHIKFYFEIDHKIINQADCIMTDVFSSMNDNDNSNELILRDFQVNNNIMNSTKDSCVFMHCLPANKGIEVTEEILNGPKSIIMKQAKNRLIAQKGILKWLNGY